VRPTLLLLASTLFLATAAAAQETPTERTAAADVIRRMNELETSLQLPAMVQRLSARDQKRDAVMARAEELPEGDFRRGDPRYQGANFDANVRAAGAVREFAVRKGATAGQVALAWLLHKGPDIVPIPGTKRRKYLQENVAAADISLTRDEMAALDAALSSDKVSGPRYNEKNAALVDR
jgi:hypothetical protein